MPFFERVYRVLATRLLDRGGPAEPVLPPGRSVYLDIAEEVGANLRSHILDNFFPGAADEPGGGFHENFGIDWSRQPSTGRSIVFQSRLTWTSAMAARRFPQDAPMYLAMTRRGAAMLAEKMWDRQGGGFHWSIDDDGRPKSPVKHMYGHAFGIYALAASHAATRDPGSLELAIQAFEWMEDHAHDDQRLGYFESVGGDGKPWTAGDSTVGAGPDQKSVNSAVHILEALTELYRVWPEGQLRLRLEEMLGLFRDRIVTEPGYLPQNVTLDWQRTPGPDSFGHDVEAGFLLVEAAEALGQREDKQTWAIARKLVDHAMKYGWDERRGGLYHTAVLAADGSVKGDLRTEKVWWVQAEHLNALLLMHERFGGETNLYWEGFVRQWNWIKRSQIDRKHGGWFRTVEADGTPIRSGKGDMWTECYHQGRALMIVSERLRTLAGDVR